MVNRRELAGLMGISTLAAAALSTTGAQAQTATKTTFDRVRETKKLRIAGIVGTEPYYHKDIATGEWSGFCISMAKDLAKEMGAEIEIIETTWGNAVLDLQSDRIDIMFGLSPTPARALTLEFTTPLMQNTFTVIAKPGFKGTTWAEINKPDVRVAFDTGSTHDNFARRFIPNANLISLKTPDDATMAVQTGRADAVIQVTLLSLVTVKKNAQVGQIYVPTPVIQQPTCAGVRVESDRRFLTYVNNWLEYNRSMGNMRQWILDSLKLVGVEEKDIPDILVF